MTLRPKETKINKTHKEIKQDHVNQMIEDRMAVVLAIVLLGIIAVSGIYTIILGH